MISTSELRIGNYFYGYKDLIETVDALSDNGNINRPECGCYGSLDWQYRQEEVNPIPLTEEWFLKFGFRKVIVGPKDAQYTWFVINDYAVERLNEQYECYKIKGLFNFREMLYVHQLQNQMYFLTGIILS